MCKSECPGGYGFRESAIFFNEKVCALSFRAKVKIVTEDNCSWVVTNNGNVNNNNRNNNNYVRAVSEFR